MLLCIGTRFYKCNTRSTNQDVYILPLQSTMMVIAPNSRARKGGKERTRLPTHPARIEHRKDTPALCLIGELRVLVCQFRLTAYEHHTELSEHISLTEYISRCGRFFFYFQIIIFFHYLITIEYKRSFLTFGLH